MKSILAVFFCIVFAQCCIAAENSASPPGQANVPEKLLKSDNDRLSYAVGVDIARNFVWSNVQPDQRHMMAGIVDAYMGNKLLISENEFRLAMDEYRRKMSDKKFKQLTGNISYAYGVDTARKLKPLGVTFNFDALARGLDDVFSAHPLLIDDAELRYLINSFQLELRQRRIKARASATKTMQNKSAVKDAPAGSGAGKVAEPKQENVD